MISRRFFALALVLAGSSAALAQELPLGFGTEMPSGSKVTTTVSSGIDVDDYVFRGYPGQTLKVSLKQPKNTGVALGLDLQRPDGGTMDLVPEGAKIKTGPEVTVLVPVQGDDGDFTLEPQQQEPILKIKYTLDQTGIWKIRVRVLDQSLPGGANGEYTLSVKYSSPKPSKTKNASPNASEQIVYALPAQGGSTLDFKLKYKGANLEFNSLVDPSGQFVNLEAGALKTKDGKLIQGKKILLVPNAPQGEYRVVFDAPGGVAPTKSNFKGKVKLPKGDSKRKGRLGNREPLISAQALNPPVGGPGTLVTASILFAFDENDPNGQPTLRFGDLELENISVFEQPDATLVSGTVPAILPEGAFPLVIETSTGQVDVRENAFTRVPPPEVLEIAPTVAPANILAPDDIDETHPLAVRITGRNFRPGSIGILLGPTAPEMALVPVRIIRESETEVVFAAPPRPTGLYIFGVLDTLTQLSDIFPPDSFEYLATPGISRVTPGLVPVLGGDDIFVKGTNFEATDKVFMETNDSPGVYDEITLTATTFVDSTLHTFKAPIRSKGTYRIYVEDDQGVQTTPRTIDYFTFADFTADLGVPTPPAGSLLDGFTTTLADYNRDGNPDLFIARPGSGGRGSVTLIKIYENDGSGGLTDVSSVVLPSPSGTDDYRADRIWAKDVNQDGWPDIQITTNSTNVPSNNVSHTRILINERRSSSSPQGERVYRDRSVDLMPGPRPGSPGDNWRGLDMWVGDIDLGPSGPPEILITHKDLKEEIDIQCGNYCSSNIGGALYRFYWGGSRAFVWDPTKRGGQGQYKFASNFFPRKSGVLVPIGNPPPGVTIPACNNGSPCRGKFTPFTGHKIVVGDINADRRPDIAVISQDTVQVNGANISSTQVAINLPSAFEITDVTDKFGEVGGDLKADAVGIALLGFPDGNSFGSIVLTKAVAPVGGARAIRIIRFLPPFDDEDVAAFADITTAAVPAVNGADAYQASAIGAFDADLDGDQDLILVANAAPSAGQPAFRILRNNIVNQQLGILSEDFAGLLGNVATPTEPFDGTNLLIGDLNGDNASEFIITRSVVPMGATGPQTRAVTTDK